MKLTRLSLLLGLGLAQAALVGCVATSGEQASAEQETKEETTVTERTLLPSAMITRVVKQEAPKIQTFTLSASDNFAFDSAELSATGKRQLDEAVLKFSLADMKGIKVVGHTDSVGSDEYNEALSLRRAASVRDYLVSRGVPSDLITAEGMGEKMPTASNDTEEGRAENRRVNIEFTAQG